MQHICSICGSEYKRQPSKKGKYCSSECYGKSELTQIEKSCQVCGKVYYARPDRKSRFCSRACQVKTWVKPKIEKTCKYCGKKCMVNPYRATTFCYCSNSCRARDLCVGKTIAIKQEKRNTRITPYERPIYRKLTSIIRARDSYTCQICGKQYKKGSYKLEVDHKIPIRLGGLDNLENLWTLCISCHRKKDYALRTKLLVSEVNYALEN